jgi:7-cyano-7-deazaguanine synthase in queuosine biosynthesis
MREIELNKTSNFVHLMSGGLDSAYSLLMTAKKLKRQFVVIHPLYFDYGQCAAEIEWQRVSRIVEYIRNFLKSRSVIDAPLKISLRSDLFQWTQSDAFKGLRGIQEPEIENRNLVIFSILTSYLMACANNQNITNPEFIITSGFKEKELNDCSRDFFDDYSKLLAKYKPNMKFHFEILRNWDREKIVSETKRLLKGSETELKKFRQLTISCYSPTVNGEPCGKCSKCKSLKKEKTRARG